MPVAKLLVAGLSESGKTETIRAVSHFPAQVVQKKIPSTQSVIKLDYGRVFVSPHLIYLYSSDQTGKMEGPDWVGLMTEMDGMVYVVNGQRPSSSPDIEYFLELLSHHNLPSIVAINGPARKDYNRSLYEKLRNALPTSVGIEIYEAIHRESSIRVVESAASRVGLLNAQ